MIEYCIAAKQMKRYCKKNEKPTNRYCMLQKLKINSICNAGRHLPPSSRATCPTMKLLTEQDRLVKDILREHLRRSRPVRGVIKIEQTRKWPNYHHPRFVISYPARPYCISRPIAFLQCTVCVCVCAWYFQLSTTNEKVPKCNRWTYSHLSALALSFSRKSLVQRDKLFPTTSMLLPCAWFFFVERMYSIMDSGTMVMKAPPTNDPAAPGFTICAPL